MPSFNRNDVIPLTLDSDDSIIFTGVASFTVAPSGGTTQYGNVSGTNQPLGPYGAAVTLVFYCETAGSYIIKNNPPSTLTQSQIDNGATGVVASTESGDLLGPGGKALISLLDEDTSANVPKLARNITPVRLPKWQKAIGRALGGGRAKLLLLADSTGMGAGAGTSGGTLVVDARPKNFPSALARSLSRMGIPTNNDHFFGDQNTVGPSVPYNQYDTRVSFPATGWASGGTNFESIGAYMFRAATSGAVFRFTPTQQFDTFEITYVQNAGLGSFTVDVDGGASLGTIVCAGSINVITQTFTTALGNHAINLTTLSATQVFLIGIRAYNSKEGGVDIIQSGFWGATIANWNNTNNRWSPGNVYADLAPDLAIVQMTINDIAQGTTNALYETRMRGVVAKLLAAGSDVILMTGIPSNPATYPNFGTSKVEEIYGIVRQIASDNNLMVIDFSAFLGNTYASANSKYGMSDSSHGSNVLYGAEGFYVANILSTFAID